MKSVKLATRAILLTVFAGLLGCGADPAAIDTPAAVTTPPPTEASESPKPDDAAEGAKGVKENQTAPQQRKARYRPPFPNRRDLFAPIRRTPMVARGDRESGTSVELMGFANVGGQKVVLAIDGVMAPMEAGTERYGVRVISIQPPEAVLQRGRNRWTATLQ